MPKPKSQPKKPPAKAATKATRREGRPSKLTPTVQESILSAISTGVTYEVACAHAGIAYSTLRNWIVAAEQGDKDPAKVELLEALKKAEAEAELSCVARIRKAAIGGQWQASAWLLERRYPERWSRRDRYEVSATNVNVNWDDLTDDELARIAAGEQPAKVLAARRR